MYENDDDDDDDFNNDDEIEELFERLKPNLGSVESGGIEELDYSTIDDELKDLLFGLPRLMHYVYETTYNLEIHAKWLQITKKYYYQNAVIALSEGHIPQAISFAIKEIENLNQILDGKIDRDNPDNPIIKIEQDENWVADWSIEHMIGGALNELGILIFQIKKKSKGQGLKALLQNFSSLKNKYINIVLKG